MTDRKQALQDLRDKAAAREARDATELPFEKAFGPHWPNGISAYRGSLDAAKALHDAVLPEWEVRTLGQTNSGYWYASLDLPPLGDINGNVTRHTVSASSFDQEIPARAWLLAILSALIAQQTDTSKEGE